MYVFMILLLPCGVLPDCELNFLVDIRYLML